MNNPELRKLFIIKTRDILVPYGFKKRASGIFTYSFSKDFIGWIGLNQGTYPNEGFEINPVIGVRCQSLEELVAALEGEKAHSYIPATISCPLGYLMPGNRYMTWTFALSAPEKMDITIKNMITAIESYGFPFMKSHLSIDSIIDGINAGYGIPVQRTYRLIAAYLKLGKQDLARSVADNWMEQLGERDDLAAQQARRFIAVCKSYPEEERTEEH